NIVRDETQIEEGMKNLEGTQSSDLEGNRSGEILAQIGELENQNETHEFKKALELYVKPRVTWNVPIIKTSDGQKEMDDEKKEEGDVEVVNQLTLEDISGLNVAANQFLALKDKKAPKFLELAVNEFLESPKEGTLKDIIRKAQDERTLTKASKDKDLITTANELLTLKAKEVLETAVNELLILKRKKVLLILGSGGTVKSTFNRYLTRRLRECAENDMTQSIPLFIALAPLEGKFVFILNGYDEIAELVDQEYLDEGSGERFWPKKNGKKGFQELTHHFRGLKCRLFQEERELVADAENNPFLDRRDQSDTLSDTEIVPSCPAIINDVIELELGPLPRKESRWFINDTDVSERWHLFKEKSLELANREGLFVESHTQQILSLSHILLLKPKQHCPLIVEVFGDELLVTMHEDIIQRLTKQETEFDRNHKRRCSFRTANSYSWPFLWRTRNFEAIRNIIERVPRLTLKGPVGEMELCTTYIDTILSPLFTDPDRGIFLRWSNKRAVESKARKPVGRAKQPDAIINEIDQLSWSLSKGHEYLYQTYDPQKNGQVEMPVFNKDAIDFYNMNCMLGFQVVEVGHIDVPMSLEQVPTFLTSLIRFSSFSMHIGPIALCLPKKRTKQAW
ncbi:17115_t:CDS:10, partial [Gigaspora rosea]